MSVIRNRLEKNDKKIRPWAQRKNISAYRLYDLDIPEYPFILDRYNDEFVFYDRSNEHITRDQERLTEARAAILDLYKINARTLHIKERARQRGLDQYEKLAQDQRIMLVTEGPLSFEVNLTDYLDTGLFLDHRPLRERLLRSAQNQRILNLFCYTGSLSVAGAVGGGVVTSVDMSQTYLDWAEQNFRVNGLKVADHNFVRADILQYLAQSSKEKYDLILLDPPTFSNSKKMVGTFEVERDQDFLIESCMSRLAPGGLLIFSNNKKKFRLSTFVQENFHVKDITKQSIPQDFHNQSIHVCFEIRTAESGSLPR